MSTKNAGNNDIFAKLGFSPIKGGIGRHADTSNRCKVRIGTDSAKTRFIINPEVGDEIVRRYGSNIRVMVDADSQDIVVMESSKYNRRKMHRPSKTGNYEVLIGAAHDILSVGHDEDFVEYNALVYHNCFLFRQGKEQPLVRSYRDFSLGNFTDIGNNRGNDQDVNRTYIRMSVNAGKPFENVRLSMPGYVADLVSDCCGGMRVSVYMSDDGRILVTSEQDAASSRKLYLTGNTDRRDIALSSDRERIYDTYGKHLRVLFDDPDINSEEGYVVFTPTGVTRG